MVAEAQHRYFPPTLLCDHHVMIPPTAAAAFCLQELVEWLDDNNFVKALFAGHTQLIRRSGDVLGFLCRERALSEQHLDIIWAAGGGGQDKDRRICVHEVGWDGVGRGGAAWGGVGRTRGNSGACTRWQPAIALIRLLELVLVNLLSWVPGRLSCEKA